MCISFIYVNNDVTTPDDYQVVIAFNRDEWFERPAQRAYFWNDDCLSGIDVQPGREGGTWFGMSSKRRRIGALLNIMQPAILLDKKPRGHLVINYLLENEDAKTYLNTLSRERFLYNPFNLILLEHVNGSWSIHYLCTDDEKTPMELSAGVIGLSNTSFDSQWKKVSKGKEMFEQIIRTHNTSNMEETLQNRLFDLMADRTRYLPDEAFEMSLAHQPNKELESGRNAIFVDFSPLFIEYGTRTTTLLLIDARGRCTYTEKTMKQSRKEDGRLTCETDSWEVSSYTFTLTGYCASANI